MATILIVDDERLLCDLLQNQLRSHGHEALSAYTGREGLVLFRQRRPRFTILDLYLPDISGLEVLRQMRELDPHAAVIILTGHPSSDLERQARGLGATEFLTKGLKLETVVLMMQEALARPLPSPAPSPRTSGRKIPGASQEPISLRVVDVMEKPADPERLAIAIQVGLILTSR